MPGPDEYQRFGALRVLHTGGSSILVDWAFRSDPGNPELIREDWE